MTPLPLDWAWQAPAGCILLAAACVVIATRMRRTRSLTAGRTLALDNVTLYSARYGLAGRPDRILRVGGAVVPEEWKSARRLWPGHIAQMGVYFLLIEERYGVRPTHGFVVLGSGKRHRIENDAKLRDWILGLADQIREARGDPHRPIAVDPRPAQCRACGQRIGCNQSRW